MGTLSGATAASDMFQLILVGLSWVSQARGQCMDTLPGGTTCAADEFYKNYPDPDACSYFYQCNGGCFTHQQCEDDYRYDLVFSWCTYPFDVDCGDRPCNDDGHCYTTTQKTTTEDCGHVMDCEAQGAGFWADPYNCRKYWQCVPHGMSTHHMCPDDQYYDMTYDGCNWKELVQCGERPVCDERDNNCVTPPTNPPTDSPTVSPDCGNHTSFCENSADGYFSDPYNCRKYWYCHNKEGDHHKCPSEQLFDIVWNGCNFPNLVDCGDRPVCGDCDEDCHGNDAGGEPADCNNSGDDHAFDCSTKPLGWYADPFNCRQTMALPSTITSVEQRGLCTTKPLLPVTGMTELTAEPDLSVMTVMKTADGIIKLF